MKLHICDNNHATMHVVVISWNLSFYLFAEDKQSHLLFWFKCKLGDWPRTDIFQTYW